VFVPGAACFGEVRGLFGGAASTLVVPERRIIPVGDIEEEGILLALAATAQHALSGRPAGAPLPELVVGHGVLGRLLARLIVALGGEPTVWEKQAVRREGDFDYRVLDPEQDDRRDYASIVDVSGDAALIDALVARLAPRGEIVLAGFYRERPSFDFAPAFMREARFRIAAEWTRPDLEEVVELVQASRLSLGGLITHHTQLRGASDDAAAAYRTAFEDPSCLKMLIDWRNCS
jgi:3-hydroxyethyl bacteriochlorophyllide a dehydrogenase